VIREMPNLKASSGCAQFCKQGYQLYQQKKHTEALLYYNKALCHARKIDSEEAALVFANRSIVYLDLELPEECLENIDLARHAGYPDKKILDMRKDKCFEMIEKNNSAETKDPVKDFFKLSYPSHEKLPFLANCIEMRKDQIYGRGLYATQDLKPGDVIAVDEPVMKSLFMNGIYKRCTNCLEVKNMNLLPCKSCVSAMFCSKKCQREANEKFHKFECPCIDILPRETLNDEILLTLFRTILQAKHAAGGLDKLKAICTNRKLQTKTFFDYDLSKDKNTSLELNQLLSAISQLSVKCGKPDFGVVKSKAIANWIFHPPLSSIWQSTKNKEDLKLVIIALVDIFWNPLIESFEDFMNSSKNFNTMNQHAEASFGSGLNLVKNYFNHSCSPNVYMVPMGERNVFITLAPIKKNEQIFNCYG